MILTKNNLRIAAENAKRAGYSDSYITESYNFSMNYDVFISHSFSDKDLVMGLKYLFKEAGYNVYIDWINDSGLSRENVNADTARLIRNRIASSKSLAYISTSNITNSKWCPWELGVSDGINRKACILPVMESSFKGQEYLGLYPFIEYQPASQTHKSDFFVCDQEEQNKYTTLAKWLSGGDLIKY